MAMNLTIGNTRVGDGERAFIIAEMACGYEGDARKAEMMIDSAAEAEADAIKFHMHTLDEYAVPAHSVYGFIRKLQLRPEEWAHLYAYARGKKLMIVAMPNDMSSLALAEKLGADAYYLHSANAADKGFVVAMARVGKPVFIGTGATTFEEIKKTISSVTRGSKRGDLQRTENTGVTPAVVPGIILMHGYQGYPTKLEENHLRLIPTMRKRFKVLIGSGEHEEGGSELSFALPLMALSLGACVIEKHITLDRKMKLTDYQSALEPAEIKRFVALVRDAEKALGSDKPHEFTADELTYRKLVKKNVVAAETIPEGKKITRKMIAFKRSPPGISPFDVGKVIGRHAKQTIEKDTVIMGEMLQ